MTPVIPQQVSENNWITGIYYIQESRVAADEWLRNKEPIFK